MAQKHKNPKVARALAGLRGVLAMICVAEEPELLRALQDREMERMRDDGSLLLSPA